MDDPAGSENAGVVDGEQGVDTLANTSPDLVDAGQGDDAVAPGAPTELVSGDGETSVPVTPFNETGRSAQDTAIVPPPSWPSAIPLPPSRSDIDLIRDAASWSPAQVNAFIDRHRPTWLAAGFNNDQINEYYGVPPVDEGMYLKFFHAVVPPVALSEIYRDVGGALWGEGQPDMPDLLKSYFIGTAHSSSVEAGGLMTGQHPLQEDLPDDAPIAQRAAEQLGEWTGDMPFIEAGGGTGAVIGGLAGSVFGPGGTLAGAAIGAEMGAFGLSASARKMLDYFYKGGSVDTFDDAWNLAEEAGKAFITGAILAPVQKVAGFVGKRLFPAAEVESAVQSAIRKHVTPIIESLTSSTAVTAVGDWIAGKPFDYKDALATAAIFHLGGSRGRSGHEMGQKVSGAELAQIELSGERHEEHAVEGEKSNGGVVVGTTSAEPETDELDPARQTREGTSPTNSDGDPEVQDTPKVRNVRHTPVETVDRLLDIYVKAGKTPIDVLREAQISSPIGSDILSASPGILSTDFKLAEPGEVDHSNDSSDSDDARQAARRLREFNDFAATHSSENLHVVSRDFVLKKNADAKRKYKIGLEHLIAVDEKGNIATHHETSNLPDAVKIGPDLERRLMDSANSYVLHHNHPNSSMLSSEDIGVLAAPGVRVVVAHGPSLRGKGAGSFSSASLTAEMANKLEKWGFDQRFEMLNNLSDVAMDAVRATASIENTSLSPKVIEFNAQEIRSRSFANNGVIDYATSHKIDQIPEPLYNQMQAAADAAVAQFLQERGLYEETKAGYDRRPVHLLPGEGVEKIFGQIGSNGKDP